MGRKITKYEILDSIYDKVSLEKSEVLKVIDLFLNEMKNALSNKSTIELRGFGTLEPRLRKARKECRNPRTGEKLSVNARYTAIFRPGKELKDSLKKLEVDENEIN